MAIFLVRHSAPDIRPGICYAATNAPVHEAEFARVMPLIDAALPPDAVIVTSPLSRCRRLADFLAMGKPGRVIMADRRFIERDLGRWTGLLWTAIPRDEAKAAAASYLDYWPPPVITENGPVLRGLNVSPRLGAGESIRAMQIRVLEAFDDFWQIAEGRNLVIISHAGPLTAIIAYWQNQPLAPGIQPSADCGDVVQLAVVDGVRRALVVRRASPPAEVDSF